MARLLFWALFLATLVLAFMPSYAPLPAIVSVSDVLNHFAAFFTLYTLNAAAYPLTPSRRRIGFFLAYGLLIEAVQSLLPTRSASAADFAVDAFAITAAHAALLLFRRLKPLRV